MNHVLYGTQVAEAAQSDTFDICSMIVLVGFYSSERAANKAHEMRL
jgi:hypothetical protein